MLTNISPTLILKYVYHELNQDERQSLEAQLAQDHQAQEAFFSLLDMRKQVDKSLAEPSDKTIQNILNFSKSYHPEPVR